MWGLLISNYLDQSLWSTNQKYWAAVRSNLLHSFLEVHNCVETFTSHSKLHEFGVEKPISWAKPAHFHFLTVHFIVWSDILSTVQMLLPCIKKWDFVPGVSIFPLHINRSYDIQLVIQEEKEPVKLPYEEIPQRIALQKDRWDPNSVI